MESRIFAAASKELRSRMIGLLDTLSAARALTDLEVQHRDVASLLRDATQILMQYQDLERCSAFVLREGELECVAGTTFEETFIEDTGGPASGARYASNRFPLGMGIVGLAAQNGTLQHCRDCGNDARFKTFRDDREEPVGSVMSAPVKDGETVLGVINVYHGQADYFETWHQHALNLFCGVIGHLLASHKAMRNLEAAVSRRTEQLEEALTEAHRLRRRYEELSTVDDLTSLYNRRFFFAEADAALSRATRHRQHFAVLLLDLDYFKAVNDSYGHSVGDRVLRGLAEALLRHTREGDILARFGGEEFVLALPNTMPAGAQILAQRIREHIKALRWEPGGRQFGVSVSIGIACLLCDRQADRKIDLEGLLKEADKALYFCKNNGRDQVRAYAELADQDLSSPNT